MATGGAGLRAGVGLGVRTGCGVAGCARGGTNTSGSGVSTGAGAMRGGGGALRGGIATPARSSAGPWGAGVGVGLACGKENPPDCSCAVTAVTGTNAALMLAQVRKSERIMARRGLEQSGVVQGVVAQE